MTTSGKTGVTGVRRIYNAFFYSMAGLSAAWKHESAFRQEALLCIVLFPLAFWLGSNAIEYSLLLGCLFLVLIAEILNSALEALTDRISTEHHPLSGRAKDMGSAAVFLALVLTGIVWGLIAWERFFAA